MEHNWCGLREDISEPFKNSLVIGKGTCWCYYKEHAGANEWNIIFKKNLVVIKKLFIFAAKIII